MYTMLPLLPVIVNALLSMTEYRDQGYITNRQMCWYAKPSEHQRALSSQLPSSWLAPDPDFGMKRGAASSSQKLVMVHLDSRHAF